MEESNYPVILKISLLLYALLCIVYGLGYIFFPNALVEMSGSEPVYHGWLQWPGCVILVLGFGAILVFRKPGNQSIFVTVMALGSLLVGLALIYAWLTPVEGSNTWFTAVPCISILVVSVLLWISRQQAKELLKSE
jgi:hypothetical protein